MALTSYDLWDRCVLVEVGPAGGIARSWSQLRVGFSVRRTLQRKPNECQVQVYGLSRDSSSWCRTKGHVLRLMAGYGGAPELLFLGGVDRAVRSEDAPEAVTTVEAADGGREFREARVYKSFTGQIMSSQVIQELATAAGLPLGFIEPFVDVPITQGVVLAGPVRDNLDKITRSLGLSWSIQDGRLQTLSASGGTPEPSVLLTPDSGLVGSPRPATDKKVKKKIELTCLLQPSLRPGRRFMLESRDYKGVYRCEDVEHRGDTHADDWFTNVTATEAG